MNRSKIARIFWLASTISIGTNLLASTLSAQLRQSASNESDAGRIVASQRDFRYEARAGTGEVTRNGDSLEFSVRSVSDAWAVQMQCNALGREIKKGDVLTLSFDAKVIPLGDTTLGDTESTGQILGFLSRSNPWQPIAKNATRDFFVTEKWNRFELAVKSEFDFERNTVYAALQFGKLAQKIAVRNVHLRYFGQIEIHELPASPLDYTPVGDDWLAKMDSEIHRNRKSEIRITVQDEQGVPIPNAKIAIDQLSHSFAFGTYVGETPIKTGPDAERFRKIIPKLFNRITVGRYWADEWGTASKKGLVKADNLLQWAAGTGLEIKSHVLIYPKYIPKSVLAQSNSPTAFQQSIEQAMQNALQRTRDFPISVWDGTNELRDDSIIADVLGTNYYARLFNIANSSQPNARWFLNEYGILSGHPARQNNVDNYEQTIQSILNAGGALEGIGIQCHFEAQDLTSMQDIWLTLDRLAKFDLPIEITEFDIDCSDEVGQAIYTRDFLTTVFAHPAVTGVTTWGFWQSEMWRPAGAMYAADWREKPNGKIWRKLVLNDWQTDESITTEADGTVKTRGFQGTYRLVVESGGQRFERQFSLPPDGVELSVQLPTT